MMSYMYDAFLVIIMSADGRTLIQICYYFVSFDLTIFRSRYFNRFNSSSLTFTHYYRIHFWRVSFLSLVFPVACFLLARCSKFSLRKTTFLNILTYNFHYLPISFHLGESDYYGFLNAIHVL